MTGPGRFGGEGIFCLSRLRLSRQKQEYPAKPQAAAPAARGGKSTQSRPGSAATELALLLPFLGLMFTAALDFGRVFNATQTLQECAFAGAVYASGSAQTSAATDPQQAAINAACASGVSLNPPVQAQNVTVKLDTVGQTATVTVAYPFQLLTPVLGPSGQIQLTRSVTLPLAPTPGN